MNLYIDGTLDDTSPMHDNDMPDEAPEISFNRSDWNIDELRFYDRDLTPEEIQLIYSSGK